MIAGIWNTYEEYISSPEWKEKSDYIKSIRPYCERCLIRDTIVCLKHNWSIYVGLQVHHKTYENCGNEDGDDVEVLCRSCHKKHHGIQCEQVIFECPLCKKKAKRRK